MIGIESTSYSDRRTGAPMIKGRRLDFSDRRMGTPTFNTETSEYSDH